MVHSGRLCHYYNTLDSAGKAYQGHTHLITDIRKLRTEKLNIRPWQVFQHCLIFDTGAVV
jgi:hypothetical protein